jgi:hypothetical protein
MSMSTVWMNRGSSANALGWHAQQDYSRGRAVPGLGWTASRTRLASRAVHPFTTTPRVRELAGLAELPNSVVALRAVPDLQARLFWTKAFLSGAMQLAVVPFPPSALPK